MTLGQPQLLWLLGLVPASAALTAWIWRRRLRAFAAWASRGLWSRLGLAVSTRRLAVVGGLVVVAVAGFSVALAMPRWGTIEQKVERRGVDVVFVLDSSLSMAAEDVRPSRLGIGRSVIRRLGGALPGHRVALVQVEGSGQVLAPLTLDAAVLDLLLDAVEPATLPKPGTELAAAFRPALRLFPEGAQKHRVLVLVTDGEDHEGGLEELLTEAEAEGVVIHAIGVGSLEGAPIPVGNGGYKTDRDGKVVVTRLDERLLEGVAAGTDGVYLRAADLSVDLQPIVDAIDGMEKRTLEGELLSTQAERFQWALAPAVLALLLHLAIGPLRSRPEGSA